MVVYESDVDENSEFARAESELEPEVESEIEVLETVSKRGVKARSWVYDYAEKLEKNGKPFFFCRFAYNNGRQCDYNVRCIKSSTSNILAHLKSKHNLSGPKLKVQTTLDKFKDMPMKKTKTFRQAFAELTAKQYLPFSLIEEKALQDSYLAFYNEWVKNKTQPAFVTGKTVSADIEKMAQQYITVMKTRFQSKLSLCMDAWTGPNKMSFLGITFTYLDENFNIQRGLLEMVKMKERHSGRYIASLFKQALSLYGIDKDMVGGVTQHNAGNCGTCVDALVKDGFDRGIFYGCFLHILNLACQAAIRVYDPEIKPVKRIKLALSDDESESEDSQDEEDPDFQDEEEDQYSEELQDVRTTSNVVSQVSHCLNERQGN